MDVWRPILLERLGVRRHIQIEHNARRGLRAVITAIDLTDSVLVTGTSLADLESKLIKETALSRMQAERIIDKSHSGQVDRGIRL